jgi:hypothetical protein
VDHKKSTGKNSECHKKEPCNTDSSTESPICGRCHMAADRPSHIFCECVAIPEFRFRHLGEHFLFWNQATMMRFRHMRYCNLSEVQTTGGIKQMETRNTSENGGGTRVILCALLILISRSRNVRILLKIWEFFLIENVISKSM